MVTKGLLLVLLVLGSCFELEDTAILYLIKSGEHYSTPRTLTPIDKNPFVFYATFDKSALYEGNDDINKLYGFSDCNSTVHDNSARFGWRGSRNKIEIFSYTYCNGVRSWHYMTDVEVDKTVRYEIKTGKDYVFKVNDSEQIEKRCNDCNRGVYTVSLPYFGGDSYAPHNIYIKIRQI